MRDPGGVDLDPDPILEKTDLTIEKHLRDRSGSDIIKSIFFNFIPKSQCNCDITQYMLQKKGKRRF